MAQSLLLSQIRIDAKALSYIMSAEDSVDIERALDLEVVKSMISYRKINKMK